MSDVQLEIKEANQALSALRETHEKLGKESAGFKEMHEKTDATLEKQEKTNQELVTTNAANLKECIELKGRLVDMESEVIRLSKSNVSGQDWRESPQYKALGEYAKFGSDITIEQKSLLRSDNDAAGGYLVPTLFAQELIKKITEISPVRSIARVMTVGKKTIEIPKRSAIPEAFYEGEAEETPQSKSSYASETMTAYALTAAVQATNDLMIDSNFDLSSLITEDVSEAIAFKENNKFVLGTGSKEPEGFLSNADVIANATSASVAGQITSDDLLLMTGELKTGYNPMYAFSRRTLAHIRTSKGTTNDHYLFQAGLAPNVPNTIAGSPYVVLNDMPDFDGTAGEIPVVYADFARGYRIIDRTGITMIRDDFAGKRKRIIEWVFYVYNTGQVVLPEAFTGLKIIAP